ncbi:hypothetical protein JDV02_000357 [Purpureocillium takamizusanense]|uniref:Aminoglycoside phosphotransferase domain-containing protein n=1 Tax=Purpureocillium takamizusanense TaxID=2060973 RepID=A0A9Q8Q6F6_9HYPO|nr:uncharacterized protein JDV02_000357 [Purpureocillium takamizusanense]UNI13632.1 hypothetical protein JDV02_000357 [Purpureocillium takamizusanense]
MSSPRDHLPPRLSVDDIHRLIRHLSLPLPTSVEALQVTAAFHSIYLLNYPASTPAIEALLPAGGAHSRQQRRRRRRPDGSTTTTTTLVLRISGNHIPRIKTVNEVATMTWVREHTSIPVPAVVAWDGVGEGTNPLGREFTLLEWVPGRSVDRMYRDMSEEAKLRLVEQLTDYLVELNGFEWHHVGGLRFDADGRVAPGRFLDDTFWLLPDVERLWPPRGGQQQQQEEVSIDTLNPRGPFASHAAFIAGYVECFIRGIDAHPSLAWLRDTIPRLRALADLLPRLPSLAATRLVLAHKDMHHANVMALEDGTITGVLDWEFAGVVPAHRWDAARAFLHPWTGEPDDVQEREKARMMRVFEGVLERKGVAPWWRLEAVHDDGVTEDVWTVVRFTRALVEVCPRGQKADKVADWRRAVEDALSRLGV